MKTTSESSLFSVLLLPEKKRICDFDCKRSAVSLARKLSRKGKRCLIRFGNPPLSAALPLKTFAI